jgi:hypothetical protein
VKILPVPPHLLAVTLMVLRVIGSDAIRKRWRSAASSSMA